MNYLVGGALASPALGSHPPARSGPASAGWAFARLTLVALALLALGSGCRPAARRLEEANTLRHGGNSRGALQRYKEILADLGDGALSPENGAVREKALRGAGDVSYLELGDYTGAVSYYRRIISLYPGSAEAREARVAIGDIYRERFGDYLAAIAQYADVAACDAPEAPRYQLEVAKTYLELKNFEQARTEARILMERWPQHALAEDAQLLNAQPGCWRSGTTRRSAPSRR